MHFQVAVSQPDMWGAKRYVASKDEYETAYFDNETEAENWRTEQTTNPFYAARPDVAGKRRPFDLAEFIETAVPLTAVCEAALAGERNSQNKINFTKE
jgi:hypothetical protein